MRTTRIVATLACSLALAAGCGGSSPQQQDGGTYEEWDPVFPACTAYEAPAVEAAPGTKFALSMYHFNVQYVPGGLKGWMTDPTFDMDNEQVEDAIVVEGLEPIVDLSVTAPEGNMGDITGGLASKRARINGTDSARDGEVLIKAQVPLSELTDYAMELKGATAGRGRYDLEFSHYEPVPALVQKQLIESYKPRHDDE